VAVHARRARGEKIGLVRIKQFRPFPRVELQRACATAKRVGVLDRNHAPGSGGIFWGEVATTLRQVPDLFVQDYIVGLGGGDVTPRTVDTIIEDLVSRNEATEPLWREVTA
jgi:pyruvate/2-oxoacid:ferredoxin oxidoreductase alpha subunit